MTDSGLLAEAPVAILREGTTVDHQDLREDQDRQEGPDLLKDLKGDRMTVERQGLTIIREEMRRLIKRTEDLHVTAQERILKRELSKSQRSRTKVQTKSKPKTDLSESEDPSFV